MNNTWVKKIGKLVVATAIFASVLGASQLLHSSQVEAATTSYKQVVAYVNVHIGAGTGYKTIATFSKGTIVQVLSQVNSYWIKVKAGTVTGYMSTSSKYAVPYAQQAPAPAPAPVVVGQGQKVVDYAMTFIGRVHYVWGKDVPSTLTFDCSSFTKYVFKQELGIDLKWGANLQYNQFPKVAKADLKPGDLVFFSVGTPGKIGHVGIYAGNGKFVHNTTGSVYSVTVSDIGSSWYVNRYIGATRPIQ